MNCAWKELLSVLPSWLSRDVDIRSQDTLQELRLRIGLPPQLICASGTLWLERKIVQEDLLFCVNTASRYSPWAAQSMAQGYITAPGGHRLGLCGEAVVQDGNMSGIRSVRSLCIRVARDFPGIGSRYSLLPGSILIVGPPGSGKTTLLRDLIRQISQKQTVAVVDERRELFPEGLWTGSGSLDILTGCPKTAGIDIMLRTMGPETIALDEISAASDCDALYQAGWCGVRLIATAHAASLSDLCRRPLYKPLLANGLFEHILTLNKDKTILEERMEQ